MTEAVVLGAGIIGLSTAWFLQQKGYQVRVLDNHDGPGMGTSYANGAQLSYSYIAPLAEPSVPHKLPKWLLDPESPLHFKLSLNPDDVCWGVRFLKACTARQSAQTTGEMLTLSMLSRKHFHEMLPELGDIRFSQTGKLVMHRSEASFQHARGQLEIQKEQGCEQQALNIDECIEVEPALADMKGVMTGGIYTPSEEAGDAYLTCVAMHKVLAEKGVQFSFNTEIRSLEKRSYDRVAVVTSGGETLESDVIVMALGNGAMPLLKKIGISVPVGPLKGYSYTVDITDPSQAPKVSITDFEKKVVFARLGDKLRVAGMADRVGSDLNLDPRRLATLKKQALDVFPKAGNYDTAEKWAGLRPATPKGKPIIDQTKFTNLWLNIGHGALGYTLAAGSGMLVSELIEGGRASIDAHPFSLGQA